MSTFIPPVAIKKPDSGHGSGGVHPPSFGGGDGERGDGFPDYGRRLNRARIGLLLTLVSISMIFITVTVAFVVLRHGTGVLNPRTNRYMREWVVVTLPIRLLVFNTFVLLVSSLTIEMARRGVAREMALAPVRSIPGIAIDRERTFPWLAATIMLGLVFLAGQWAAWQVMRSQGFHIFTGVPTPFFYVLTGTHAVHLLGGIVVLGYAGVIAWLNRPIEHRTIVLEVASWYWHFMGGLWIYVFGLLQFAR
jgi:cytochrome c oxidase subunit 3